MFCFYQSLSLFTTSYHLFDAFFHPSCVSLLPCRWRLSLPLPELMELFSPLRESLVRHHQLDSEVCAMHQSLGDASPESSVPTNIFPFFQSIPKSPATAPPSTLASSIRPSSAMRRSRRTWSTTAAARSSPATSTWPKTPRQRSPTVP